MEGNRFAKYELEAPEDAPAFGDFASDTPEQAAMTPEEIAAAPKPEPQKPNRFAKYEIENETGALEAGAVHAALGAAPAIGSIPAAVASGAIGGSWAGLPGALAGGLIGGGLAAYGIGKAQNWALSQLPDDWRDPLEAELQKTEAEHPTASFLGGLVPFALTMKPGPLALKGAVPKPGATAMERLLANPVTARLFGGGLMGGVELAQQKLEGEPIDWTHAAIATGFGVIFNEPWGLGKRLHALGARAVGKGAEAPAAAPVDDAPTAAELADLGVMGKGVTEATSRGELEMAPEAKAEAHAARSAEMEPPAPDLHDLARRHEPEVFARYDALAEQRDHLRARIRELHNPPDTALAEAEASRAAAQQAYDAHLQEAGGYTGSKEARRLRAHLREAERGVEALTGRREAWARGEAVDDPHVADLRAKLMEVDAEMRDLGREKAAAYRRAAEHGGGEIVEPELTGEVSVAPEGPAETPKASLDERLDKLDEERHSMADDAEFDEKGFRIPGLHDAIQTATASFRVAGEEGKEAVDIALAHGRRDVAEIIVERAERAAENDNLTPGVPEDSPKYESIKADLARRKAENQAYAAELRAKLEQSEKAEAAAENPETGIPASEPAAPSIDEQRAFIASDVASQLEAAGRPKDEAEDAGHLIAARYIPRANLFKGALGTPRELYEREGAIIRGDGRAAQSTPTAPRPVEPPPLMPTEAKPDFPPPRAEAAPEKPAEAPASEETARAEEMLNAEAPAAAPVEELAPQAARPESVGGEIASLDPADIHVDAERFQFKAGGDAAGVTERLQGVKKWDARLAGTALVWKDAEGKYWIADGHQRLGLAKRLSDEGQKVRLNAFILDAAHGISDADARVIAAVKNIAEGTGTPIDAAKIMKEAEGKGIDLPPLPPRSTLVKDGEALARLSPEAFGMAVNDVVPTNQAAIVGRLVSDPAQQVEALRVLHKAGPDNARQAEMIVRDMLATGTEDATQISLFGEEHFASSVVLERAKVADEAAKQLRRDKSTFKTLVAEAERIQSHGANALDTEANQARLSTDEQAAQFLTQLATRKGPVSDALTGIARRFKSGELSRAAAAREFLGAVRGEIESGLVEGDHAGGAVAGAAGERELAQAPKFEPGAEGKPQQLIPGVEPVTDRELAALLAEKPMQGGNAPPPEGGLFDEESRNQTELFQSAKGKITLREGRKPIITLMKDADASTFIHETGHDFLEQLLRDSRHDLAPPQLRDDATTVLDWIGAKSAEDVKTKHHEKFARGFEQYLREGVAPSKELAGVFSRFKDWLLQIYRTIRGLGAPINDDIRAVFDRMLAEEPQRTVIAPERSREPTFADIHETDAALTDPHEAEAVADRVAAERQRAAQEPPPEIADEIAPAIAEVEVERAAAEGATAEPGGETGGGESGRGEMGDRGEEARPLARGDGVGAGPSPERAGGDAAAAKVDRLLRGDEREPGAGKSPLDGVMPRARETLIGQPNRVSSLDNLVTELGGADPEVKAYLDKLLPETNDFNEARRGHITHGQIAEWYEESGRPPEDLEQHIIGQAWNAEALYENGRAIRALKERIFQHAANGDVVAFERDYRLREALIKGFVGARAEAGRALAVFRRLLKEERLLAAGGDDFGQRELFQLWREITGKDYERSQSEADAVSKLQSPAAVSQFLNSMEQRTFGRMAHEYWMCAIVSNYISQMTDTVGNFVTAVNKLTLEVPVAAALGASKGEAERVRIGEVGAGLKALPGAVAPAAKAAVETLRTGRLVELPGQELQSSLDIYNFGQRGEKLHEGAGWSDVKAATFGLLTGIHDSLRAMGAIMDGGVAGAPLVKPLHTERGLVPNLEVRGVEVPLGDFLRSPLNFLKSMESFSASLAFAIEKNQIAYRRAANEGLEGAMLDARVAQLIKEPPVEMLEEAVREARVNALAYKGGAMTAIVSRLVNHPNIGGWPVGKFLVPFVNISSIMLNEALLKRTPLGFLSPEIRADLLGKNGPIAQQKAQARMMVGTSIGLMGMTLAAMGKITGSAPDDPKERAIQQAAGIQPYSVKIGDSWYSYKRLGVFGLHLGIAADLFLVAQKATAKEMADAVGTFIHAIAKNVIDQSYFKGPSEFLRAVSEKGYGEHYIQNFLTGFVPFSSGVGQTAALIDPYSREARNVADAIKAKIPFVSESLRPKLDIFGRPIPSRDPLGPFAIWVQKQATDPVAHEMRRLEYFPSLPDRKIGGVKLTDAQYHDFASMAGIMAKARLDVLVNSGRWSTFADDDKKNAMKAIFEQSRQIARDKTFAKNRDLLIQARDLKRAQITGANHGQ